MVLHLPKTTEPEDGLRAQCIADEKRALAKSVFEVSEISALLYEKEAEQAEAFATDVLRLTEVRQRGTGGEIELDDLNSPGLVDTTRNPDSVNARASRHRLELASDAGCLALAADAAETIKARNSLEKMLSHQIAAAHVTAMRMLAKVQDVLAGLNCGYGADTVEIARLSNAATRLLDTYQKGAETILKLRGNRLPNVTVQNVQVNDQGKAIVASGGLDET